MNPWAAIRNLIVRVKVDRAGAKPQVRFFGTRAAPGVEHMEPQGLHFQPPAGAQGVGLAPAGDPAAMVAVGLSAAPPAGTLADGEGGLHYLGTWRVFLDADGTVHLGARDPADFVALASKVLDELNAIKKWADAHTHTCAAPSSPSSPPVLPMTTPGDVGSTVLKAE